jgi:hypothetical protein
MIAASNILLALAVVCAFCGVASAMMMVAVLQKHGVKINWIWLRLLILTRYLGQYRDVTRRQTGRTGPLFYSYVVAMILALVTATVGLALRA